jgi:hypothetical protein
MRCKGDQDQRNDTPNWENKFAMEVTNFKNLFLDIITREAATQHLVSLRSQANQLTHIETDVTTLEASFFFVFFGSRLTPDREGAEERLTFVRVRGRDQCIESSAPHYY